MQERKLKRDKVKMAKEAQLKLLKACLERLNKAKVREMEVGGVQIG